ncbi:MULTISPECIES: hypothetical protein [unclassified Pseudonocardia]|jgi:hypothetical protein|uniref:hypothetical protein n=1 Tax=unclassified Pseudonocardia TaxID=2619320 RepID=UPI00096964D4|nr:MULTISPECIES: hypothetical protein [unclassified Pseudonocardia]MBN9100050.1 hypothetical protein [Pseudonocardia sp.]OJY39681.1 MAG: hypothetical protein BGP03_03255 [Pseudonocardia sp. 73-21]
MIDGPRAEHRQREHRVRPEWGVQGVELLARECSVAAHLPDRSPETDLAVARFAAARAGLRATLGALSSGRELVADVDLAAAHATSTAVPRLSAGGLTDAPAR